MFFDIQRFDSYTTTGDKWTVLTEYDATQYTEVNSSTNNTAVFWGFVPAGTSYTKGATINDNGKTDQAYIFAKNDITLKINNAARINNCIDSSAIVDAFSVKHGIAGNATAITLVLHDRQSVRDLVVEGANKTALKITIDGTVYNVYPEGYVDTVARYGLMSYADKIKLDKLVSDTTQMKLDIIDWSVAVQTAIAGGEMTADGFILKNKVGLDVATIPTVGLDAATAAATYATKEEMRE